MDKLLNFDNESPSLNGEKKISFTDESRNSLQSPTAKLQSYDINMDAIVSQESSNYSQEIAAVPKDDDFNDGEGEKGLLASSSCPTIASNLLPNLPLGRFLSVSKG